MLRVEVLGEDDRILSTYKLERGLTILGQSPNAHIPLRGKGVGALHVAIKLGAQEKDPLVIMDLGGPTKLRIDGEEKIEQILNKNSAVLEIGSRRVRILKNSVILPALQKQEWVPVTDEKSKQLCIRARLYVNGVPEQAHTSTKDFFYNGSRMIWFKGNQAFAQLPTEWIQYGGRIQIGKSAIGKLSDWAEPVTLEQNTVYRVQAGNYLLEILISEGRLVIGKGNFDFFPKELRKPFTISALSVLVIFALWITLFGHPESKVEEPYKIYARIQNIPVEKIFEPEPPHNEPLAGGGSGSEQKQSTAPQVGGAQPQPSKLAQALTGGLKNLVGNVLSQSTATNSVVAESGIGQVAAKAGSGSTAAGKLTAVGAATNGIAGAAQLGKLGIAGSGKGFGGGSGTGLGTGSGAGIGSGVGEGIGRGGFRLVEEESIVDGGLDKSVIAAVIQNNLSQIKYCYERQLVADPDLFGKVVVLWHINAQGLVENASVKQTTLSSPAVEQCMISKISGWKFPNPKNGTKVTVSYPFLFKSTK